MRNPFEIEGEITKIFITTKEGVEVVALIDTEDIPKVAKYRWHAAKQRDSYRIVCHMKPDKLSSKQAFYLHRIVTDAPAKKFVDHINCEPTDNRKANLRFTDFKGNGQNRRQLHSTNTSGVRNVTWHKRDQRWQAMVKVKDKNRFLGYFTELEDAKKAVMEARAKYLPYSQEAMMA